VHQFEIMPKPPDERSPLTPWPLWPMQLRIEGAHEEGGIRDWSIATTKFAGESGSVKQLHAVRVGSPPKFEPIPGSDFTMEADLVLIAMGFLGPVRNGMIEQLGVALDQRGKCGDGSQLHVSCARRFLRLAICGEANRWWSGPLPRAARRRLPSILTSGPRRCVLLL